MWWLLNCFNFKKPKIYAIYGKEKISCNVLNFKKENNSRFCGHEVDFIIGIYQNKYTADNIANKLNNKYNLNKYGGSINFSKNIYFPFYVLEHELNTLI